MDRERLRRLLEQFREGELSPEDVIEALARLPFRELGEACLDTHRSLRQGAPEVVLGQGKNAGQIVRIVQALRDEGADVLVTRVDGTVAREVQAELSELSYRPGARLLMLHQGSAPRAGRGTIAVVSAGTADLGVAEEAALTAEFYGNKVERVYDVGVAGLHRVFGFLDTLREARVVVVVAGMEGALPSVIGGLVERPVIAVPTRVGYGASFGGIAALLGMLNSCSPNVTVVNIDNGFGAAFVASIINRD